MDTINAHFDLSKDEYDTDNKSLAYLLKTKTGYLNLTILLLRCTIGIILFVVGSGKVFGWFGGFGLETTLKFYTQMGIAYPFAYMSIYTEFIGGLLLTIGFLTRPALIAVIINMLVATIIMFPNGFLGPNGSSYPFMFLVIAVAIFLAGPMSFSIDALLLRKMK